MKSSKNLIAVGLSVACLVGLSACSTTTPNDTDQASQAGQISQTEQTPETESVDRVRTGSQGDVEDPMERVPSVDFECGQVTMLSTLEFRVGLREAQGTATPEDLAREKADLQDLFARISTGNGKTPITPHLRAAKKQAEDGVDGEQFGRAMADARNACSANGSMTYIMARPGEGG